MPPFDVILVLPYVASDHPSFPEGMLKRALEAAGFSVGLIERPAWHAADAFRALGKARLFFGVVAGPIDSIVLNYTSSRKRRREDLYQPDGEAYFAGQPPSIKSKVRPDRTALVYAQRLREAWPDAVIALGGVEATMRTFAHYDFQQDAVRRSVLVDARADLAVRGMGEAQAVALARALAGGADPAALALPGTARVVPAAALPADAVLLPSCEEIQADRGRLVAATVAERRAFAAGARVAQAHAGRYVLAEPPAVYASADLDAVYGLPFSRRHPGQDGYTPALRMNLFSVTAHRGCGGGCAFCAIAAHEGKRIVSRSEESILREIRSFAGHPAWKGVVSDIGGASAEMYGADCPRPLSPVEGRCARDACLHPETCRSFRPGDRYLDLLRAARHLPGVKQVLLGSGVRYDALLGNEELLGELLRHHAGRYLRVAPEHTEDTVLRLMRKPGGGTFERFVALFREVSRGLPRPVGLAAYAIVGHPGETDDDARRMASRFRELGVSDVDAQLFTPTPGTLSTAMWAAGTDLEGHPIPVERDVRALERRKALLAGGK